MTKKISRNFSVSVLPSVNHQQGLELLQTLIKKADDMVSMQEVEASNITAWETLAKDYLMKIFGSGSPNIGSVVDAPTITSLHIAMSDGEWNQFRRELMQSRIKILDSLVEILQTEIQIQNDSAVQVQHQTGEKIFIVHGHDQNLLNQIARFCEKLGLSVIILQERADKGRTIIEKFEEECHGVGFAIVLMTGDDRGATKEEDFENQRLRPRQNVVLELGLFLGRLGRSRVAVVYEDGVEIPSDYSGVLYVKLELGDAWKFTVARELKAAGYSVDMNKIF